MNIFYISIQATYSSASLSLFSHDACLETVFINDTRASSYLIPYFDVLLKKHCLRLKDLAFIAIDQGPGAFTSLRVSIATVNGISFGQQVPLIGVDGLDALGYCMAQRNTRVPSLYITMLNAYNNDVYYAFYGAQNQALTAIEKGCKKIEIVLDECSKHVTNHTPIFAGNGSYLHRDKIYSVLGDGVVFVDPELLTANSECIGILAYKTYKETTERLFKIEPTYMKTQYFAVRNSVH